MKWFANRLNWVPKILWGLLAAYVIVVTATAWRYNRDVTRALGDGVRACRCVCEGE